MTTPAHAKLAYSGKPFGDPNTKMLSNARKIQKGKLPNSELVPVNSDLPYVGQMFNEAQTTGGNAVLGGQDVVVADWATKGLAVYAGYYNGFYANLSALAEHVGPDPYIVSITPTGENGARAGDVEPGCMEVWQTPAFVRNAEHGTGREQAGKPVIYCSASDAQAVIDELTNAGIARTRYLLWLAHWIGYHICGPDVCGYPQADASQYATNDHFDTDVWYGYCFSPPKPVPPAKPVYDVVQNFGVVNIGPDSVKVSFEAPAGPPDAPAVAEYELVVWHGSGPDGIVAQEYPRYRAKGTNPEVWQGGSLVAEAPYTVGCRAISEYPDKIGASPWAWRVFRTTKT
jgi:hypothetical protein